VESLHHPSVDRAAAVTTSHGSDIQGRLDEERCIAQVRTALDGGSAVVHPSSQSRSTVVTPLQIDEPDGLSTSVLETRAPGHGMATGLPRSEPSPAGKLDEEMKTKHWRLLAYLGVAVVISVTVAEPMTVWARTAPTTQAVGDPTDVDGAPAPAPRKSAASLSVSSLGASQPAPRLAVPGNGKVRVLDLIRYVMASISYFTFRF
jgi:hypothetical protein